METKLALALSIGLIAPVLLMLGIATSRRLRERNVALSKFWVVELVGRPGCTLYFTGEYDNDIPNVSASIYRAKSYASKEHAEQAAIELPPAPSAQWEAREHAWAT